MSERVGPQDIPFPVLEKGDFVRLKDPQKVPKSALTGPLRETYEELVRRRANKQGDKKMHMVQSKLLSAYEKEGYEDLFYLTHGTVVEIIGRTNVNETFARDISDISSGRDEEYLPRTVSLHLYNPEHGIAYMDSHSTEPGRPEFVDYPATALILLQKHDQTWDDPAEVDIAQAYQSWGLNLADPTTGGGVDG